MYTLIVELPRLETSCFELTPKSKKIMGENTSMTKGVAESSMDQKVNVYIWDMDETLILLKSLLNGTYAEAFNGSKNVQEGVEIGKIWEKQILSLCDDHFFYEQVSLDLHLQMHMVFCMYLFAELHGIIDFIYLVQIENYNKPYLDVLSQYDDGRNLSEYDFNKDEFGPSNGDDNKRKLAYRHRVIAHRYKQVSNPALFCRRIF